MKKIKMEWNGIKKLKHKDEPQWEKKAEQINSRNARVCLISTWPWLSSFAPWPGPSSGGPPVSHKAPAAALVHSHPQEDLQCRKRRRRHQSRLVSSDALSQ